MTGIGYGPPLYPQTHTFQYDANGRLGGMQAPDQYGNMTTVATASYGVAGEMTGFTYGSTGISSAKRCQMALMSLRGRCRTTN